MRPLDRDADARLESYLDRVGRELERGAVPPSEVVEVRENLRAQVLEMAAESGGNRPIDMPELEALLSRLDEAHDFEPVPAEREQAPPPVSGQASPAQWERRGELPRPYDARAFEDSASSRRFLGVLASMAALGSLAGAFAASLLPHASEDLPGALLLLGQIVALVAGAFSWRTLGGRFGIACALVLLALVAFLALSGGVA